MLLRIIADAAHAMPHTLRRVDLDGWALAELEVLVGHGDELAAQSTAATPRIRGLVQQAHGIGRAADGNAPRKGERLAADISTLDEQTVIIPGAAVSEKVPAGLAGRL